MEFKWRSCVVHRLFSDPCRFIINVSVGASIEFKWRIAPSRQADKTQTTSRGWGSKTTRTLILIQLIRSSGFYHLVQQWIVVITITSASSSCCWTIKTVWVISTDSYVKMHSMSRLPLINSVATNIMLIKAYQILNQADLISNHSFLHTV